MNTYNDQTLIKSNQIHLRRINVPKKHDYISFTSLMSVSAFV